MFVIYISDNLDTSDYENCYGYFTGKCYIKYGETFPITDSRITNRTKKYTNNNNAIKVAESLLNKCNYVLLYKIEEIKEIKEDE